MHESSKSTWQNWVISALATLVMFFAGLYTSSLDTRLEAQGTKVAEHDSRITTLEETKRNDAITLKDIKEQLQRIENAVRSQNK